MRKERPTKSRHMLGGIRTQAHRVSNPGLCCSFRDVWELLLERFLHPAPHQIVPLFNWRSVLLGLEDLLELGSHQWNAGRNIWGGGKPRHWRRHPPCPLCLEHLCPASHLHLTPSSDGPLCVHWDLAQVSPPLGSHSLSLLHPKTG